MTDKLTKRFVSIDDGEVYYITDTQNLKTLNDYIQEFKKPEYEFTEKEAISAAKEEYWQMIYENSMSAKENENMLNELFEENEQLKKELKVYHKVARCSNCKYHNYDWDIDDGYGGEEYEVCDKGNNVDEGICKEWEEL